MAASDKLMQEMHEAAKKPKVEGSQTPITNAGDGQDSSVAAAAPRRPASFGGSDASVFQAMIGGPFGGRTGSAQTKAESINKLPI
jgi:hypothetical protein